MIGLGDPPWQHRFGYHHLVFSVLALLGATERPRAGGSGWMLGVARESAGEGR